MLFPLIPAQSTDNDIQYITVGQNVGRRRLPGSRNTRRCRLLVYIKAKVCHYSVPV